MTFTKGKDQDWHVTRPSSDEIIFKVPPVPGFQCEICNWDAPSKQILQDHVYVLHEFPQIRPISPVSDNSPSSSPENETSSTLDVNANRNSNSTVNTNINTKPKVANAEKHKCPKCGASFTRNNCIYRHLIKSCPKNPDSKYYVKKKSGYECKICGKMFSTITNRNQHYRNNHHLSIPYPQ